MATLQEIGDIENDPLYGALLQKVRAAAAIKASLVVDDGASPAARLTWAKETLANIDGAGENLIYYAIGKNEAETLANILGANDTQIQTNINAAVDALYS
jgi:hypothetical protein